MGVPSTLFLTSFPLPPQATHRCTWRRVTCTRRWWSCCCTTDLTQRCETHLLSLYRVGRIGNFVQTQPRCLPAPQGARPSSIRGSVLELVEGLKTQDALLILNGALDKQNFICAVGSVLELVEGLKTQNPSTAFPVNVHLTNPFLAQVRDQQSRSVLELVEGLKTQIPNDASVAQRRFALERCSEILTGTVAFFDRFGLLNFDLYEC